LAPLLLLFTSNHEGVVDQFLIGEPSYLLGFERTMGRQVFESAGKVIEFDAGVVDWMRGGLL
jgi:hypothetical protein